MPTYAGVRVVGVPAAACVSPAAPPSQMALNNCGACLDFDSGVNNMPAALNTLPSEYYTADAILAAETEHIFRKRWMCVGRAAEIASPGDYFLRTVGGDNLIILRDRSGTVQALHNVCRHRGTRLCAEASGQLRETIQCPYHAWTYALDGRLLGAPNMNAVADFDKAEHGLYRAQAGVWQGFIFVNLDTAGESLADAMAPLAGKFEMWNLPNLQRAQRIEYDAPANWKLLAENYSECYHCPLVHPALEKLSPHDSGNNDLIAGPFLGGFMDLYDGHSSLTATGGTSRPPLGRVCGADLQRVHYYSLFPNLLLSLHPDYVMFHTLWPQSPERTLITCEWLFDAQAMAQPGFDAADAVEFWDMTNRQDWHICGETQAGMRSRMYRPGKLQSEQELLSAAFDAEVLKALGHA